MIMANKRSTVLRHLVRPSAAVFNADLPKIIACEEPLEQAVHLLVHAVAAKPRNGRKPVVVHSLRVAFKLMSLGYDLDIVLAGLLHDLLEKSVLTPRQVLRRFGLEVASIVQATTNDVRIRDPIARYADSVLRCASYGDGALLVRAADLVDNCERGLILGGVRRLGRLSKKTHLLIHACHDEDLDSSLVDDLVKLQRRINRRLNGMALVRTRKS